MTGASARSGAHPFDESLADAWAWRWILPSWQLCVQHWRSIVPVALAYGVAVWLLPKLQLSGPGKDEFWRLGIDVLLATAVSATLMAIGYVQLARAEGGPYFVGQVQPGADIARRMAQLSAFWIGFALLVGFLIRLLVTVAFKTELAIRLTLWLFGKLGWWSIPFMTWLIAPIGIALGVWAALTHVRAIRGDEPIAALVVDSARRVGTGVLRILIPAWVIGALLILLTWVAAKPISAVFLKLAIQAPALTVIVGAAIGMAQALALWFVIERVYAPELGAEPVDEEEALPAALATESERQPLAQQLAELQQAEGPAVAARRLVNWIRARQRPPAELAALFASVGDREALVREMGTLAVEWSATSRPGELPWLVDQGLTLSPQFMQDQPDRVLALAKKLTSAERADLATRLLLGFLKQHRAHPDHLAAGLQLARVLATHAGNPDGARKLLAQLAQIYPSDPQAGMLLKQLGLG